MKEWIKAWYKIDIDEVSRSLLVVGILNAECFSCHAIGLSKDTLLCPQCGIKFRYIGFRKKVAHRDLEGFAQDRQLIFIDFDDFMLEFNRNKAKKFLDSP